MRVSIITVAYHSEECIGTAIASVLQQKALGKNTIEYLIIDGASRDKTVEVAESFRTALEAVGVEYRIISEPDKGIYNAMNKGITMATGDIIGILNSDDWYEEDTISKVVDTFGHTGCDLMFGNIRMHKRDGSTFVKKARLRSFQTSRDWNHPTMFVKASLYKACPFREKGIHDDYACYLQMKSLGIKIITVDKVLANFRMGGASNRKSLKDSIKRIRDRYVYCYRHNGYSRWYLIECIVIEAAKIILG